MGILAGNSKEEPLHYGEIFAIWGYLHAANSALVAYQTFLNHADDEQLRNFISDKIQNCIRPEIDQLERILKVNGIGLPLAAPERPFASNAQIPTGARFTDPEIAGGLAADITAGLVLCSTIIGQSIREDIAAMFTQYHALKLQYGSRLLRMKKEKGWLVPPPLHTSKPVIHGND
ncbi:DUF3231 family protein [Desulfuribacillus alkaliarsenatis]|uniref:DUF3231 domain-containing protein n=1 Tax=Desulfuribacillus alkaliarsenatis TaxID=766136 RepID=A0A1E5G3K4_9FIRM|nr:DUF3231 family protein [Desulfuribacillus alkaliarsenatis]OEF97655.1 hypothetical protein BHF68_14515 [Desulfuribacillus alkaliarsenatis]